jgi:spermidine/putrescine transport system ATP-binding protein
MKQIKVQSVSKFYDGEKILDNLSITIPGGQFFALLGPSGCGKTSLLRLIAGLEAVDTGKIYLGEQDITNLAIYERKINTVFQHYALFPHLTVFENVAYSLRIKGVSENKIKDQVSEILKISRLTGQENKKPKNLSGGQQQRVSLARAIINKPAVLLLDEPLAALDFSLKKQMLIELINLQEKLGMTFIYVTHDQSEALTVADKMAIMNADGNIEQIGTPKEIYEFPATKFVATFVGTTNLFEGVLSLKNEKHEVIVENLGVFEVFISGQKPWMVEGRKVLISLRPEKILITKKTMDGFSNCIKGDILEIVYSGQSTDYRVKVKNGQKLKIFEQNEEHFPQENLDYDDQVYLYFQKENVVILEST